MIKERKVSNMSDFYTNIILKMVYTVYMSERYIIYIPYILKSRLALPLLNRPVSSFDGLSGLLGYVKLAVACNWFQ